MSKKILLVDDDLAIRTMFEAGLKIYGYDVATAQDGEVAFALLQEDRFEVTLMDVMMPRMSGIELLEKVSKENLLPSMGKIIAFTSLDKSVLADKLERFGISLCLDKSDLTPEILNDILKKSL